MSKRFVKFLAGVISLTCMLGVVAIPAKAATTNESFKYIETDYGTKIETSVDRELKSPSFSAVKFTANSITAKIKKVKGVKKYQFQCATNEKFTWILSDITTNKKSYTFKNLLEKRTHYIRVRTIQVIDGKTVYSPWSKTKTITTKDDPKTNQDTEVTTRVKAVIKEQTNSKMTDYEKLLAIHNWMAEFIDYDHTLQHYDVYSAVMEGSGICSSYSQAVLLFCEEMNIPCKRFTGTVGFNGYSAGHAWNTVKFNGKWYIYDVTLADSNYGTDGLHEKTYDFGWNIYPENFLMPYDYVNWAGQCYKDYFHCDETFPTPAGKSKKYLEAAVESVKESILNEVASYYADQGYTVVIPDREGEDWFTATRDASLKIMEEMADSKRDEFVIVSDLRWEEQLFYKDGDYTYNEETYGITKINIDTTLCSPSTWTYANIIRLEYK